MWLKSQRLGLLCKLIQVYVHSCPFFPDCCSASRNGWSELLPSIISGKECATKACEGKLCVCRLIPWQVLTEAERLRPGAERDAELHCTRRTPGLGGIRGDCCFRMNRPDFSILRGLGPVPGGSCHSLPSAELHCRDSWCTPPRGKAAWAEGGWESFCAPLTSTSWGLFRNRAAGEYTFPSRKLWCPSECLLQPLEDDLKWLNFLISHGLLKGLVSFGLLLLELLCSIVTVTQLSSAPVFGLFLKEWPAITSADYKKLMFTGRCVRRRRQ